MKTRTFRSGNSEAVRLPKEVAYGEPGLELEVVRTGDVVTLRPVRGGVRALIAELEKLPRPTTVETRDTFEAPDRPGL
jgi:antitoxin VapB